MATFGDAWRLVQLHAAIPDPMLCRTWVQWAYSQFCDRIKWSHLRSETAITILDQKSGTCTVTRGLATVTGGTLTFAASDIGRQFRLGTIPIYTIIAVDATGGTSATLERVYTEANGSPTAYILDAYVTMPADFHTFLSVLDPENRWRLRWWVPGNLLDSWDPARQSTGNPRLLANQAYSPVPGQTGRPRYELYPYQTGFKTYPVWYYRKPENLADTTEFIGPLTNGLETIVAGALARCAMWPGTVEAKNPYFSLSLAGEHRKLFEDRLAEVNVVDQEVYFENLPMTQFGWADFPWDAQWLQAHEPYMIG